ncbi:TonB-dependent receptor [Luteimonas composti]|uniref:TonB-dependent receptor n=1 Tax=Luteimonas composti TaxID=398257 RepID=A0ABT6MT15_9GAMM|nr:TonB-dependent receptor [Luteimonas composti]MDH7453784.1 TonB-dependent receptor [Luteimonas composti]
MSNPNLIRLSVAAVLAASPPAVATPQATDLDEVLVTGTRTEVRLAESLLPAEVLDRDQIERSQARDLIELLRGRAGVDVGNTGGRGKLSSLYLRGAESDHVLVLVDGIKMNSATAGMAAFQDLPLAQIERIEIIRGPRSSLYGSEAIGGVVQVFTRRAQARGLSPQFTVGAGSHGAREASAGFDLRGERGWLGVHGAYDSTDGFNACRGSGALFQGCFADEPDDDGYRNVSIGLRGGAQLGEATELDGSFLQADGENAFDGSWTNRSRVRQQVSGLRLRHAPRQGRLELSAALGRNQDRSDDYQGQELRSAFLTRRDSASLQADLELRAGHLLTTGIDHQRDRVDSLMPYTVDARDNTGVFVGYDGKLGAQRLQASVRNDDNAQFGNHLTGSLGWGTTLASGLRLSANAATGFKAPTFNDLYYPGSESPWLQPETSRSLNLGLSRATASHRWSLDVFESRIDDLIVFVYPPPDFLGVGSNIDQARIRGAEFGFDTTLAGIDVSLQLSHADPRDRSGGANHDRVLARRARNTGRIGLDREFGPLRAGITVNGAGARYDDAANSVRLGGHATTDLRLEYAFHRDWTLLARASNVFDREYETVAWYYQPGREYQLTLRWRPAVR